MNPMPPPTATATATAIGRDAGRTPYPDLTLTSRRVPAHLRSFLPAQARAGARFTGPAQVRTLGLLGLSTYRGAARSLVASADGTSEPHLVLGVHSFGRATLVRGDGTVSRGPDDLFVCDGAVPFLLHEATPFELHLVRVPRLALAVTDRQARDLTGRTDFAGSPVASVFGPFLRQFLDTLPEYAPRTALRLATTITGFVGSLAAEAVPDPRRQEPGSEPAREQQELLDRVRSYVDARLGDRTLTPATVAGAQHISVRYLHKLFEGQGCTVGRWIRHRRLEEARRDLAAPGSAGVTVSAVARRWGFANATHFSRSFRAAYGMSPREWRSRTRPSGATGSGAG
ncbi:helix-turn-helix domain-containing protein [Streptomyces cinerochromogenes]|uniref:Helix-turn-helix domain-containing protein n=1 Tax=Streptomyces cinerochromogenes TaxID=66422 RepID=A0ABW7AXM2_9ACTN